MCRIAIYIGSKEKFGEIYKPVIDSFREVSRYDWIFERYSGEKSHSDGWGFLGYNIEKSSVSHYRSMTPFYEDDLDILDGWLESVDGDIVFLLHVRAGSPNMAKNIFSVHPIYIESPSGSQIYLIHNGTLYKEALARLIGEDVNSPRYKIYNDTYYVGRLIADMKVFSSAKLQNILEILRQPKYLYSAFNFGLLWLSEKTNFLIVGPLYRRDKGSQLIDYYRLYKVEEEGYDLYISSTNREWLEKRGFKFGFREVDNGFITIYPGLKLDGAIGFNI